MLGREYIRSGEEDPAAEEGRAPLETRSLRTSLRGGGGVLTLGSTDRTCPNRSRFGAATRPGVCPIEMNENFLKICTTSSSVPIAACRPTLVPFTPASIASLPPADRRAAVLDRLAELPEHVLRLLADLREPAVGRQETKQDGLALCWDTS